MFLADLELWVQDWLDDWLIANQDSPITCTLLAELIEKFTTTASSQYAANPENISLMLLTAMDLWMALDKCSIQHYPLLSKYNPGFPVALLNPLEKDASTYGSSLLFQDVDKENSFGVQYFNQSLQHRKKWREIKAAATIEREEKKRQPQRLESKTLSRNDQLKRLIKNLEQDAANTANDTRNMKIAPLKKEFQVKLTEYQNVERDYRTRRQEQIRRQYLIVNPDATDTDASGDPNSQNVFQMAC
ncbi:hypothetical protein VE03_10524 [Pseudogymnoascus sp. 23342-1-I1]|nr:hypothetical protein VE03_10524 [Pseudogymnoascus sp. 23342-1-I1]